MYIVFYTWMEDNPQLVNYYIKNYLHVMNQEDKRSIKSTTFMFEIPIIELYHFLLKHRDQVSFSFAQEK